MISSQKKYHGNNRRLEFQNKSQQTISTPIICASKRNFISESFYDVSILQNERFKSPQDSALLDKRRIRGDLGLRFRIPVDQAMPVGRLRQVVGRRLIRGRRRLGPLQRILVTSSGPSRQRSAVVIVAAVPTAVRAIVRRRGEWRRHEAPWRARLTYVDLNVIIVVVFVTWRFRVLVHGLLETPVFPWRLLVPARGLGLVRQRSLGFRLGFPAEQRAPETARPRVAPLQMLDVGAVRVVSVVRHEGRRLSPARLRSDVPVVVELLERVQKGLGAGISPAGERCVGGGRGAVNVVGGEGARWFGVRVVFVLFFQRFLQLPLLRRNVVFAFVWALAHVWFRFHATSPFFVIFIITIFFLLFFGSTGKKPRSTMGEEKTSWFSNTANVNRKTVDSSGI